MERLTKTYSDRTHGAADNLPCGENSYEYKGLLLETLGKYEDAEEQGLLLRLPCKIGDTVYQVTGDFISEFEILRAIIYPKTILFQWMCIKGVYCTSVEGFYRFEIGTNVFLTREEAEAKLKEMEDANVHECDQ